MKISLSTKEYLGYENFIMGEKKFCIFNEYDGDKYIMFHGDKDGGIDIGLFFIFMFYSLLKYKVICCYPKQMKTSLKFGKFLLGNCSTPLDIVGKRWVDGGELIIMGNGKISGSGRLNLRKKNRN